MSFKARLAAIFAVLALALGGGIAYADSGSDSGSGVSGGDAAQCDNSGIENPCAEPDDDEADDDDCDNSGPDNPCAEPDEDDADDEDEDEEDDD